MHFVKDSYYNCIKFYLLILVQIFLYLKKKINDKYGIRTHEAYAVDLESTPFDHSGNLSNISDTGNRTPANSVKASYPNH